MYQHKSAEKLLWRVV